MNTTPTQAAAVLTGQFRKKPVVIEAVQISKRMDILSPQWLYEAILDNKVVLHGMGKLTRDQPWIAIHTLEGVMRGDAGDWIIRGVKGELYPCKPDIFESTYEPAVPALLGASVGEPVKALGKRLAELLDEDQWAECEKLLLNTAAGPRRLVSKWRHAAEHLGFEGLASLADCADELEAVLSATPTASGDMVSVPKGGADDLPQRLIDAARRESLTWEDRIAIGNAIARIQAASAHTVGGAVLAELKKMTDAYAKAMKDAGVSYYPEALVIVREARAVIAAAQPTLRTATEELLFADMKTDEQKADFFLSGRAYETGVIAKAIQNDVSMAYRRCAEYAKALAAQEPSAAAEPVATVIKRGADRAWMSERMGDLPDGTYPLYLAAPVAVAGQGEALSENARHFERMFLAAVQSIAEISVALGIPEDEAEVANGNDLILAAIRSMQGNATLVGHVAFVPNRKAPKVEWRHSVAIRDGAPLFIGLATPASPAPHGGAKPVAHYLVVTGEVHEGQETYTVHDKPVPLADNWKLYAAPQEHEARDAARPTWIDPHNRVPAVDQTVLVYSQQPWEKAPSIKLDTWAEQHEAPLAWSSATIPIGLGWSEHDDFELVLGWLPLPSAPDAARAVKGDRT